MQKRPVNFRTLVRIGLGAAALSLLAIGNAPAADEPPMTIARDGFFYVGGKLAKVGDRTIITGQMFVEYRIPAKQTHPYPIVMVHGGTRSATTYLGTPDGREGWAQYFVRQGYAVYLAEQPGRGRSGYDTASYGPSRVGDLEGTLRRYLQQSKFKLWPQAHLHTQWPGTGEPDDPATIMMLSNFLPEIVDFTKQQFLNRDALVALLDKIGPAVVMTHSQGGAFGWPVADARPDLVKAILAVEPNGPPFYQVDFIGAPDYFKQGPLALPYGITAVPLNYSPAVADAKELGVRRGGQGGRARPGEVLRAEGAGAQAAQSQDADPGGDGRSLLSRAVRPLHGEVSAAGRRQSDVHAARRSGHQGQQPRDDEREEQQGDRRRDRRLARQDHSADAVDADCVPGAAQRRSIFAALVRCRPGTATNTASGTVPDQRCTTTCCTASGTRLRVIRYSRMRRFKPTLGGHGL